MPELKQNFASFDGMCWPLPSERLGEIEYKMRYDNVFTRSDMLIAASVLNAYRELVTCSAEKRRTVISGIRQYT